MNRTLIAVGLVWLVSLGHWCLHAAGQEPLQPAVPELLKREVSKEGIAYLEKLQKRTPAAQGSRPPPRFLQKRNPAGLL